MRRIPIAAALLLAALPALANDSIAELSTGGLILSRTDAVAMDREVLSISEKSVAVDYVFRNVTDADVTTIVAFPMPAISGSPFDWPAVPRDPDDNFLGFSVTVEGEPVEAELEQRALAVGVDVSADLKAHDVPLYPNGDRVMEALAGLPDTVAQDWIARGIIVIDEYDDGSGWKRVRSPYWSLNSTYWWRMTFPAAKTVAVSHRYTPSVGKSVGLRFFMDGKFESSEDQAYQGKYCFDDAFRKAVERAARKNPNGYPDLYETRISYILKTGGNWATGAIGDYTLTVDKGEPDALVSFCGEDVRKTGPTTFQMTAKDYYPARDIEILILRKPDWDAQSAKPDTPVRKAVRKPSPGASLSGG